MARLPGKLKSFAGLINLAFIFDPLAGGNFADDVDIFARALERPVEDSTMPPAMLLFATPSPSSNLPPDRSCKVAAWIPKVTGLRP